jgi:peroxidase
MGLPKKTTFAQVTNDTALATKLQQRYTNVDQIDAFVGCLSENRVTGSSVGELVGTIIKNQFERLMHGDPFFYLEDADVWDPEVRAYILDIEDLTLARIIDWNTIVTRDVTKSAFFK